MNNTINTFRLLFDTEYRGLALSFLTERALPALLGFFIIIVGIAFVIAGTKAADALGNVAELVATKGASLVE